MVEAGLRAGQLARRLRVSVGSVFVEEEVVEEEAIEELVLRRVLDQERLNWCWRWRKPPVPSPSSNVPQTKLFHGYVG